MFSRLYYATKLRIDKVADYLINRSGVVLETSARIRNPLLRQTTTTWATATANFCHLVKQLPRLDTVRVTGTLGSLIYVGEKDGYTIGVLEALFPQGYEETDVGRTPLWKLPAQTRVWLQENDLVICRVSQFFPWRIPAAYAFNSLLRVWQILPLDKPLDELLAGSNSSKRSLRTKINRAAKMNYSYRISHSTEDLRRFYYDMLVPTVQQRHRHRAIIEPFEFFENQFKSCFLLFLILDGQEVAAVLCSTKNAVYHYKCIGNPQGSRDLIKQDVNTIIYWRMIQCAFDMEMQKLNFEGSFGWVNDGVFTYKQRWGAKVHSDPGDHDQLLFRAQDLSVEWREHLNNIGFITSNRGQYLRIFIDGPNPSPIEEGIADAANQGLDGIQIVSANHRKNHVQPSLQSASTISS